MQNKILKKKSTQNKKPQENNNQSPSSSDSEQDPEFEYLSDAEDFEDYKVDGYHPAYIGETFKDGRYKIIQKLGWGHFSTVWLAQDTTNNEYVALKIQKSKKSYQESAQDEIELLQDLKKNEKNQKWIAFIDEYNQKHPQESPLSYEENYCIELLDTFVHYGMHGKHYCSIFHIMGPNLLDLIQHFDSNDANMPIWLVKLIAKQCLIGLTYFHEGCSVIHTDLKPENIMIQLSKESFHDFVEQVKSIEKKPISMLFLKKRQQKMSKNAKKKQKKKQNKQKDENTNQQNIPPQVQPEDNLKQQQNNASPKKENTQEKEQKVEEVKQQTNEQNNQEKEEQKQQENDQNNQEKEEQKQEEDIKEKNKEEKQKDDDLYTLVWKEKIRIKLDRNLKIKIVDFGNACWTYKKFSTTIQTREYRAPEVILGIDYEPNTDVFSLACMIYELITNDYLFKPKKREGTSKSDEHLALMMECLGKFSKQFCLSGTKSRDFFNKNGQLLRIKDVIEYPISEILIKEYDMDEQQAVDIENFLLPMLNYNPKKRAQAREVLEHQWLNQE